MTIPVKAVPVGARRRLAGKLVIDTNNYYPQRDGQIAVLDDGSTTVSGHLQQHLPSRRWSRRSTTSAPPTSAPRRPRRHAGRLALSVAGDDPESRATVVALIDELGFDAVDAGPLSESWRFEKDHAAYGLKSDVAGMTKALAEA